MLRHAIRVAVVDIYVATKFFSVAAALQPPRGFDFRSDRAPLITPDAALITLRCI